MQIAKVFKDGRSQAICLPNEFHVEADNVYLTKTPEGFLVMTRNPWDVFCEGVNELSDAFMSGGRLQPPVQERT